jgi:diacylglycerol kinase family enzyme
LGDVSVATLDQPHSEERPLPHDERERVPGFDTVLSSARMGAAGYLIVNPRSGDDEVSLDELLEEAAQRRIACHVLAEGEDIAALAREAKADAIGIAGGDGSLGVVAAVAIERGLPFVCVPFGTRNHFARDLGLDRDDPVAALEAFAGVERLVDVGSIDGRLFLNNVSLGLYAELVRHRERHRRRGEGLAAASALAAALRRRHPLDVVVNDRRVRARVILIANNAYGIEGFTIGGRESLTDGMLYLYTTEALLPRRWDERAGAAFEVSCERERQVLVAIDGEPMVLPTPLRLTILARGLRMLVPPGSVQPEPRG